MLIRNFGQVVPLTRNTEPILHVRIVGSSFRLLAAIRSLFAIFVGQAESLGHGDLIHLIS